MYRKFNIFFLLFTSVSIEGKFNENSFPPDFLFGTATSSYQIEGAWNISDKGENIWDTFTHQHPDKILDGSNGDIACDSYHKYKEDVALLKEMGVQFYRFSLSWSRILPKGLSYKINPDGIRYYNDLIDTLLENDIIPMVTIFHWDLPQPLQNLGGFTNELMVNWFEEYSKIVFEHFGDRIQLWLTFNEPVVTCLYGYGIGKKAPGYTLSGTAEYLCAYNLIKAHAKVYHLYKENYKENQKGKIGITIPAHWMEAASSTDADVKAAQKILDFTFGWYADPIFHPDGDYPRSMKDRIGKRSKSEGFTRSRLPEFTSEEVQYIRGSYDYFGVNHYTTCLAADKENDPISELSFLKDVAVEYYYNPDWPSAASPWLKVVPWGFRKLLNYIKNRYSEVEIYITENGFSDYGELNDQGRIDYYEQYLSALLDAIHEDGVNVKAYAAWSLLDNLEWEDGYKYLFGLHHVDFNDPERSRTKKASAKYFKELISNGKLPNRK